MNPIRILKNVFKMWHLANAIFQIWKKKKKKDDDDKIVQKLLTGKKWTQSLPC